MHQGFACQLVINGFSIYLILGAGLLTNVKGWLRLLARQIGNYLATSYLSSK